MEKIKLLSYSAIISALILFGFYSNTMNYANALDVFVLTFSSPPHYGIMDVSYRPQNDKWFFASPYNNTILQVDDSNVFDTSFLTNIGGGDCSGPKQVLATISYPYLAVICEGGVQYHSATSPYTVLNASSQFQGGNYDRIAEWLDANRVYMATEGNAVVVWNDLDCVGVECSASQAYGTISFTTTCNNDNIMDLTIDDTDNIMWFTCDNEVVGYDLTSATVVIETAIGVGGGANLLSGIAYNPFVDRLVVVGLSGTANDIYVLNGATGALLSTVILNVNCVDVAPNTQTDIVYILCNGNETLLTFDIGDLAVESTSVISAVDGVGGGAADTLPSLEFSSAEQTGYVVHNEDDTTSGGTTQNFATGFIDIIAGGGEGGGGSAVNGQCPVGSTALECVGSGTSPFAGITGGRNVTDITRSLTDGVGFTNCGEDGDVETCGSGLFTFLFLLLMTEFLSLAGYLAFAKKMNAEIQIVDIGLMVLLIGFVDLAIGFYLNWIPDIVFYSIIVIVAGFLTFGMFTRLRGG